MFVVKSIWFPVCWRMCVKSVSVWKEHQWYLNPVMRNHQHIRWSLWHRATHMQNAGQTLAECWFDSGRCVSLKVPLKNINKDPKIERSGTCNATLGLDRQLCKVQEPSQLVLKSNSPVIWPKLWCRRDWNSVKCSFIPTDANSTSYWKWYSFTGGRRYMIVMKS